MKCRHFSLWNQRELVKVDDYRACKEWWLLINLNVRDDGQGRIILFEKITGRQRALQRLIEVVAKKAVI